MLLSAYFPPLLPLPEPAAQARNIRLLLLRDDLTHPTMPGNKWRKLKFNLLAARQQGCRTLLTFGGAYSNHLAAVAAAGRLLGFATVGVVRGEELALRPLNPTLAQARADGMHLHFVSRTDYRHRHEPAWVAGLPGAGPLTYVLPEGGSNNLALPGCAELVTELRTHAAFDYLAVACGTGGTLAGFLTALRAPEQAVGIAALPPGAWLRADIDRLVQAATGVAPPAYSLHEDAEQVAYAGFSPELLAFIRQFEARHGVLLDPVYTGKLLQNVLRLVEEDFFRPGSTVVVVHTGGLQGWAGYRQRFAGRSAWWPSATLQNGGGTKRC